jgi:hypothetical protein
MYIEYDNKEIPVIIDFAVIKQFQMKHKIKLSNFEEVVNDLQLTEELVKLAIRRGCKLESIEDEYSKNAEDILSDSYAEFLEIFNESVTKMFVTKKSREADKKK